MGRSGATSERPTRQPIETWQIWNEPNLSSFWSPAVDPVAYGALMLATAPAIRAVDPDAQILLAGLVGHEDERQADEHRARFLRELYGVAGVTQTFDGIAIHPYSHTAHGTLGQIQAVRAIADSYGDDASLLGYGARLGLGGQAPLGLGQDSARPGAGARPRASGTRGQRRAVGRARRLLVRVA